MPKSTTVIFVLFSLLLSASHVWAAEDETHAANESNQKQAAVLPVSGLKRWTWDLVLASEQVKGHDSQDDYHVIGQYTSLKTSLLFAATEHDEFRVYGSFVNERYTDYDGSSYFELAEVMYRRKGILTPQKHGISLDFELKDGEVLDSGIRRLWGFSGETIPQFILKKQLPYGLGLQAKIRHHFYHRMNAKPSTLDGEDRLYLTGNKMLGQSFILNTELKYRRKSYMGPHYSYELGGPEGQIHQDVVVRPSVMYLAGQKALFEGYVESKLMSTFDDRSLGTLLKDEFLVGAALYFTVL